MPNVLRNMRVKRVAFVDEGANPDAFISFAKNKDGGTDEAAASVDDGVVKRAFAAFLKAFKPIIKDAATFNEEMEARDYYEAYSQVCQMTWVFLDSMYSILMDKEKTPAEKALMMKQSQKEFLALLESSTDKWANGEQASAEVKSDVALDSLAKMRDMLNERIEKGCGGKKPTKTKKEEDGEGKDDDDSDNDDDDDKDDKEKDVKKGANQDMGKVVFDTAKMTPEEKATYDDFAKRFGTVEDDGADKAGAVVKGNNANTNEGEDDGADDMFKGLHPAVKAELESLRKFREDAQMREYVEVAKRYELLGKKPEELATVLKALKSAGGSAYDDMIGVLDANLSVVEKSGAFTEIGKRGADTSGDAWGKIEAAAHEIVKSKQGMNWADAVNAACEQHPELVAEYEKGRK